MYLPSYLLVLFQLPLITHVSVAFLAEDCPGQSQRRLRQYAYCNSSSLYYICLHDTETDKVKEVCDNKTDYAGPGEKYYVWTGGFRNINCQLNRYQPENLLRSESHECQFIKSSCGGEGQILHRNGSYVEDTSCRCDETRNYTYVTEHENKVECVPSKDDCSCYLVPCSTYNNISDASCGQHTVHTKSSVSPGSRILHRVNNSSNKYSPIANGQNARSTIVAKIVLLSVFVLLIGFVCVIGLAYKFPLWFYACNLLVTEICSIEHTATEADDIVLNVNSPQPKTHDVSSDGVYSQSKSEILCTKPAVSRVDDDAVISPQSKPTADSCDGVCSQSETEIVCTKPTVSKTDDKASNVNSSQPKRHAGSSDGVSNLPKSETKLCTKPAASKTDENALNVTTSQSIPHASSSDGERNNTEHEQDIPCSSSPLSIYNESNCSASGNGLEDLPVLISVQVQEKEKSCEVDHSCNIKCYFSASKNLKVFPEWIFRSKGKDIIIIPSEVSNKYQTETSPLSSVNDKIVKCLMLTVKSIKPADSGKYVCRLKSEFGQVISNDATTTLKVEIPAFDTPVIILASKEVTCVALSSATIKCSVSVPNYYLISVKWYVRKESKEIAIDIGNHQKYSGGNTEEPSLTIQHVTPDDQGEYYCTVTTHHNYHVDSEPVSVTVEVEKPSVIVLKSRHVVMENDSVLFVCTVVSNFSKVSKIQWKFQKHGSDIITNIKNSRKYTCDEGTCEENVTCLTINSVRQSDGGKYWCIATNSIGKSDCKEEQRIQLTIISRKPPPVIIPECQLVNLGVGLKSSISWVLISDSQISHISVKKNDSEFDLKVLVVCHQTDPRVKFVLVDLYQPGTYVCCCRNNYRQSNSTIKVELLEDYHANIDYVTAIDIGSMWTKVAISKLTDCATPNMFMSQSEPTCLLFRNGEVLFGEQAKVELKTTLTDATFYENFVAEICRSEDIVENTKIEGREEIEAFDIFVQIIKELKTSAMNHLDLKPESINLARVLWVLILPSRLFNTGKNFFLSCCSEVGLDKGRILLVSESTAIMSKIEAEQGSLQRPLPEYLAYVLVDFGGYTCKVSAVKKVGFTIEEIAETSIMSAGGSLIDDKVLDILESIVGDRVIEELKKEYEKFIKLVENVKHHINEKEDYIKLEIPIEMTNELCKKYKNRTFPECLEVTEYNSSGDYKNIVFDEPFLYIGKARVNTILDGVSQIIIEQVQRYMEGLYDVKFCGIIFVGGCSNIDPINEKLTKAFPELNVERGEGAMETIKGGLRFGCIPNVIISRVTQFAVLRRRQLDYQTGVQWGLSKCCDSDELVPILKRRSYIPVGQDLRIEFSTVFERQTKISIELFISLNDNEHVLTDEENEQVLSETIQLADISTERRYLDTFLEFGYDVISLKVVERRTKIERRYSFPLK